LAFISPVKSRSSENKFLGFKNEAVANGLPEPLYFCQKEYGKNCDSKIISLIRSGKIRAGLCSNDLVAGYLIQMLQFNGIRVPEDFAVIGFDGMSFSEFLKPNLTTVIQPLREIAIAAVKILLQKIEKKELKRTAHPKKLEPLLHVGESCGCKNKNAPVFNKESYLVTLSDTEKELP
jgi:DNA-binding LacI/PurR family transcriptional regulator